MVRMTICGAVLCLALVLTTSLAGAQPTMTSGLQSDTAFGLDSAGDPAANMATAQALGARFVRVFVTWKEVAPPSSQPCVVPPASVLDDPAAYNFSRAARQVENAHSRGIAIYLAFNGPFPCYGSLEPSRCTTTPDNCTWRPNAQLYRKLVHAFAVRYGHLINRWSPYNEPNNPDFLAQTNAAGQRTAPVIYRSLWFNARNEIRATTSTGAPIFYGDVAGFQADWIRDALCFTPVSSNDPAYPSCTSSPTIVNAEAIAFHPYLNKKPDTPSIKNLNQINDAGATLEAAQTRNLITTPSYTTITESGVHYGACYTNANLGGQRHCDPNDAGQIGDQAASERRQAAWMNCVEENAYKDRHVVGIAQYLLQDGPARNPGDVWYTGLRREANPFQVGTDKPAFGAWRMPFTVERLADGRLEVWGAYRPRPAPASVTIVALAGGGVVTYQRTVPTGAQGYFRALLTDAPTGYSWQARAGAFASRVATGTDCS